MGAESELVRGGKIITEPGGERIKHRNPWLLIVVAAILFTIAAVVVRMWEVVLVLSILLLLNLSWRLRSRAKATADGGYILNYGSGMTWFALIGAILIGALLIYDAVTYDPVRLNQVGTDIEARAVLEMSFFVILVWPLFIEGTFSWHVVNNEGIDKHSAWSCHLFMRWDEIDSITFTAVNQWFVIKGDKGTIRLHTYLIGLPEFAKAVRAHVPQEKWNEAMELIMRSANNGKIDETSLSEVGHNELGLKKKGQNN